MSAVYKRLNGNRKSCFTFVFLLLFTSLSSIVAVPNSEAAAGGDLGIIATVYPPEETWIAAYDSIRFQVEIENFHAAPSSSGRVLDWYVCEGVKNSNVCISSSIEDGSITISSILPGTSEIFESSTYFNPNGYHGNMTIVYQFNQFDFDPNNDVYSYLVNSTNTYMDIKIDNDAAVLDQIENLAIYDGQPIINSNTSYSFEFEGFSHLCGTCQLNSSIGWELWDLGLVQKISESYINYSAFPKYGYYKPLTIDLPAFEHNTTGEFILIYGMFNSSGTPNNDMISENNLNQEYIVINDDVDLAIIQMNPSHNPSSPEYYFGDGMIKTILQNNGNKSVHNLSVSMQIFDAVSTLQSSDDCLIEVIHPGNLFTCYFDALTSGDYLEIVVMIPDITEDGIDNNPENNVINENTDIIIPSLSGYIINNNLKEWYTNVEQISLNGNANLFAPGPINYSWWYAGIINLGYGENITLDCNTLGLGEHVIRLTVRDIFGNTENIFEIIKVYHYSEKDNSPEYVASGVTTEVSTIIIQSMLPTIGESYGVGNDKSPLLLISFDIVRETDNQSLFSGNNWMNIELNTSYLLLDSIPFDSLEIRQLESFEDTSWEHFEGNTPGFNTVEENISLTIYEATTILLIGSVNAPNIDASNFTTSLAEGGTFRLDWDPTGDINNDYIGGWNIYQISLPETGGTVFPSSNQNFNQLVWEDLTANSFRTFLPIEENHWYDSLKLEDGVCTSYAVVPVDRQGVAYFEKANVTTDENGNGTYMCGDDQPPASNAIQFQHNWEFTNSSDCFKIDNDWSMCYSVELTWTWPEHEMDGNVTWNLYRIEQNPNGIDISLITPIWANIEATPMQTENFTEYGWDDDGIRPQRTYYYILTPVDWVGNEKSVIQFPSQNVERVYIEDDWWSYYQHLIPIPPEPEEPPLGNEWLGNFSESLEQDEFKYAGIVVLVTLCISLIMLPLIIKKRKRLNRVISARNRQKMTDSMADEFDDYFD
ncbi:MAG: hypothetical protein QF479_00550 [Candidatus Poseidoniaceae archaeon]|nr:hypothetical protein [Candidatus Poseidoniaceae archaeon]